MKDGTVASDIPQAIEDAKTRLEELKKTYQQYGAPFYDYFIKNLSDKSTKATIDRLLLEAKNQIANQPRQNVEEFYNCINALKAKLPPGEPVIVNQYNNKKNTSVNAVEDDLELSEKPYKRKNGCCTLN